MGNALLTKEQIRQLLNSWHNASAGSQEQKLIEDLFLITDTVMPVRKARRGMVAA